VLARNHFLVLELLRGTAAVPLCHLFLFARAAATSVQVALLPQVYEEFLHSRISGVFLVFQSPSSG